LQYFLKVCSVSASISGLTDIAVELCVCLDSVELAQKIYMAVLPEVTTWPRGSTKVALEVSGEKVCAYIHAPRISDVRAALNSVGSWLHVAATLLGEPT